ncbi:uncharacterized protein LOC131283094 [Anopheles ziemanni]|uniref:uncharacterized protein LOC131267502 n=1 Tax=Anopheles coustani TaxID=139045 RepID=UPI00265AAA56|nr:uncharacterized protein LOC131267502 [Anopheles coustani]XP_058168643.1 uncharacterized protein LOC131283094 [Anopheles ziemanni]
MAVKSKKPTPAKESPKAKVEKTKKKKKAANPEVEEDAMENEVNPPQDSDEEMATEELADPDGDHKKSTPHAKAKGSKESKKKVLKNAKLSFGQRNELSVYVRGLQNKVTDADLQKFFESVGKVAKVRYIHCQRAAIVRFEKAGLVEKALALSSTSLKGLPAYVERLRPVLPSQKTKQPKQHSEKKLKKKEQENQKDKKKAKKQKDNPR